jgi:hypothetical protein
MNRIELKKPEDALRVLPNILGIIACQMLREYGEYKCVIAGEKTDIVIVK